MNDYVIRILTDAIKAERSAADLLGYFQTGEDAAKYEACKAVTDAIVSCLR